MKHHWEIRAALILILLLVVLGLQACGQAPVIDRVLDPEPRTQTQTQDTELKGQGVTNFQSIADALGCVFAPQTCQNTSK